MAPRIWKFIRNHLLLLCRCRLSCGGRRRNQEDVEGNQEDLESKTIDPVDASSPAIDTPQMAECNETEMDQIITVSVPPKSCSEADALESGPAVSAEPALPPVSTKTDSAMYLPPTSSPEIPFETPEEENSGEASEVEESLTATTENKNIDCTTNEKSADERIQAISQILSDMEEIPSLMLGVLSGYQEILSDMQEALSDMEDLFTDINYWWEKKSELVDEKVPDGISTSEEGCEQEVLLEDIIMTSPEVNMTSPEVNMTSPEVNNMFTPPIPSTSTNCYRREISALLELQKYDDPKQAETPIANSKRPKGKKLKRIRDFFKNLF